MGTAWETRGEVCSGVRRWRTGLQTLAVAVCLLESWHELVAEGLSSMETSIQTRDWAH